MTMTDTEAKALALVNEIRAERGRNPVKTVIGFNDSDWDMAFHRAIERLEATEARHAAELREQAERFSEALVAIRRKTVPQRLHDAFDELAAPFIIAKPDPLVEAIKDLSWDETTAAEEWAADLRAALAKHGLKLERIDQ